ncbi:hypothetical protein DL98DRAFT_29856 [Cadophora sp. DSE1049]|nr:hypothetical protein DL98DRAFT_29856 [Cadophora sp. DSE1049]
MVKPSIHWNAIRTLLAPLQAQPSTIVQPRNTADALSLLANYVNAAATNKPQSVVIEKSASTEQCPWTNVAVRTTSTQKPALQRVPSPQPGLSKSTPRTPSTTMIYPSAFEDPEQQWHRYKAAFRISDIDRLMMEEAAKNEGDLRMVLDEESGQIVSVEELVKRTVYRCSLKVAKGAGTGGGVASGNGGLNGRNGGEMAVNKKRKIGDGGGGRDGDRQDGREEKRACV